MRRFASCFLLGLLLIPFTGLIACSLGWLPVSATSNPPRWESFFVRRAFAAAVARRAPRMQNPFPPTSANLKSGLKFYRDDCSGCHGDAGKPSHWGTSDFYPRVPQFDSNPPTKPDWQMFWIVKHGVRYTGMGAWEGLTSDDNIWKAVGFLSHLKDLPPEVAAEWRGQQPSN
ncbi:MAG TPA: cytochrome c [Candidatus Acidoferrum sp.]|nr:cytochrome c [Candidatus Acidoferrum sp.]